MTKVGPLKAALKIGEVSPDVNNPGRRGIKGP